MPTVPDIFLLRKRRTRSLKINMSVLKQKKGHHVGRCSIFRPKSSEGQKKIFTPSDCPLYVYHFYTTKVLYICFRRGGGSSGPQYSSSIPPIFSCRTSANVMTFFGLHFILGKKLVIWESDDLFFCLHFILGKKLGICAGMSNRPPQSQKMVNFAESSPPMLNIDLHPCQERSKTAKTNLRVGALY